MKQLQQKYDASRAEQSKLRAQNLQLRQQLRTTPKHLVTKRQGKRSKMRQKPSLLELLEDASEEVKDREEPARLRTMCGDVRKCGGALEGKVRRTRIVS
jgi:hypothetical protein